MRVPGSSGQTAADYRPFTREDSYNVAPYNYSQTPNERGALWLLGSQPLTGSARLFIEGLYHRRVSSQDAAPEQFLSLADPTPTLDNGAPGIPASNYYNPFGVDLPFAARRFVEGPVRVMREEVDVWRLVVGANGGAPEWHWELAAGIAHGRSTTRSQGLFAGSRYVDALGPSGPSDSGQIVCGARDPLTGRVPEANIIPGCVPLDIFDGAGSVTQSQLDYMIPRAIVDSGTNEQRFAQAVFGGRLRGDLHWVAGAEYRREAGSLVGDPLRALQYASLLDPALPGGSFDCHELFAELSVPLLAGPGPAPWIALNLGARWSQFSSFGSDTSWDAGLRWQLTSTVTVRASYATVFREPDLQELYGARSLDADYGFDPCGNHPTPTQRTHCAANGVPGGAYVQGDDEFAVVSGGNPALQAETGATYGLGVVYEPAWLRGFSASADLYDIELSGVIDAQDIQELLYNCAQYGTAASCAAIHRQPDGHPLVVAAVNRNFGHRSVRGVDLALEGQRPTAIGNLGVGVRATYLERWDDQPFAGGQRLHQAGGTEAGPLPRWRATAHVDWRRRAWYASYALQYIGSMTERVEDFPPLGIFFPPYARQVSSALYHELEAHYSWRHGVVLDFAVTNLTDKAPPFLNTGVPENTDPGTYPLLGRTFFVGLSYTF
jgi:outer membrane receptor protein involved in Fe transport